MATPAAVLGKGLGDMLNSNNSFGGLQKLIPTQKHDIEYSEIKEENIPEAEPIMMLTPELETDKPKSNYKTFDFPYSEQEYFNDEIAERRIAIDASDFSRTSAEKTIDYFNFQMQRHGWIIKAYRQMLNDYKQYLSENPKDKFIEENTSLGVFGSDKKNTMYEKKIAQLRYESGNSV